MTAARYATALGLTTALFALTGCAGSVRAPDEEDDSRIRPGNQPGELVVDATEDSLFPPPGEGRSFESEAALYEYLVERYGARPVHDAEGNLVGARGSIAELGRARYRDPETDEVRPLGDVIGADLGGADGLVHVGEQAHCVRPGVCSDDGWGGQLISLPKRERDCDWRDKFCIESHAFKNNYFFYRSIGTTVKNTRGARDSGYERCVRDHRTDPPTERCTPAGNRLQLTNYYQLDQSWGWSVTDSYRSRSDVDELTHKHYAYGVNTKLKGVCDAVSTSVCEIVGVCGQHRGSGDRAYGEGSASTAVGTGRQLSGHCAGGRFPTVE